MTARLRRASSAGIRDRWPRGVRWAFAGLGLLALVVAMAPVIGLTALVWVPLALLTGGAMLTVWAARRHRQVAEGRDPLERRDAPRAMHPWPREGVIDDRLPEP